MATTIAVPIDLRNPRISSLGGNAFYTVLGLTAWDAGAWSFVKDVEGRVYGVAPVPKNVSAVPNARITLMLGANAAAGVTRMKVATKAIADGESLNPAALTAEASQDVAVPATARLRKDVTFPAAGALAEAIVADDLVLVEITHEGTHANDTLAVNTELYEAFLVLDVG